MNQVEDILALVKSAFTGQDQLIEHAFEESDSFRSLCEDYHACVVALERWKQRKTPDASQRQQEYASLLVDLDREIQAWLEAGPPPGARKHGPREGKSP